MFLKKIIKFLRRFRVSNIYFFSRGNTIRFSCDARRTRVCVLGKGNKLLVDDSVNARDVKIFIRGNNNSLIIDRDVTLLGEYILDGDNNSITIGKNTCIGGGWFFAHYGSSISIGEGCLFSMRTNVRTTDSHSILDEHGKRINPEKNIVIGDRVWFGKEVTVLKGVTIGDDVVVGTMSVVTKDIPGNTVSAGNPARVVKQNITWDEAIVDS